MLPRGVIHAGDCIETGDPANVKMQQTEWNSFAREFGLTGKDGRLKLPIYEVHGNHDGTRDKGLPIKQIIERNKTRPGVTNTSKNGLHYSWDWEHVHFVNLGIVVGQDQAVKRKRRYDPLGSLDFLVADLKEKVEARPVGRSSSRIMWTCFVKCRRCPWRTRRRLGWSGIRPMCVHSLMRCRTTTSLRSCMATAPRNVFRWDGTTKGAETGIPVFNVSKSSHFASKQQAFFYIEIQGDNINARRVPDERRLGDGHLDATVLDGGPWQRSSDR